MSKQVPIFVSNKFRSILKRIYTESWIAEKLLDGRIDSDLLVDKPINYIRISGSDSTKISYLPPKKVEQTVKEISKRYRGNGELIPLQDIPMDAMFKAKGRVKIKYGSFVNKLFKDIPPKDVEKFASLLKSIMSQPPFSMEIVTGKDIQKYYSVHHHSAQRGSLGVSCMRHDQCQSWFEMYTNNPNEIKMLIMFDRNNRVMARALLWDLGKENGLEDEFRFMDRIYSTKDDQTHHFFDWAKKNGYSYKEKQSWNTPYRFQSKDNKFEKKMKIRLSQSPAKYAKSNGGHGLPYLDTFKWLNIKDGTMYNYKPDEVADKRDIFTPVATNGDYYGFNYIKEDEYHKEYWYEGEIKTVPYLDKLVSERYLTWSNINDCYILKSHAIRDPYIKDYIFNEEYEQHNNRAQIDKIIEAKKEKERLRLEKIKKDVMKSLKYFEKYVEVCEPFLSGQRKTIARPQYPETKSKSLSEKDLMKKFIKTRYTDSSSRGYYAPRPTSTSDTPRVEQEDTPIETTTSREWIAGDDLNETLNAMLGDELDRIIQQDGGNRYEEYMNTITTRLRGLDENGGQDQNENNG